MVVTSVMSEESDKPRLPAEFGSKLYDLIKKSQNVLNRFRENYQKFYELFVGDMYLGREGEDPVFLNKMQQAVAIEARSLAAHCPRCLVKTRNRHLRPLVRTYQAILNRDLKGIRLEQEIQKNLIDSQMFMGIGKTALCASDEIKSVNDTRFDPGKPFISRVSPDSFFYDTSATTLESCQFMGDVVEIDKKWIHESGHFGSEKEIKEWIGSNSKSDGRNTGLRSLSGSTSDDPRLYETVFMREIYLPREQMIVWMPINSKKIVREQKWLGHKSGPYDLLLLLEVPDNVVPLAPASNLYHLAMLINKLMVKSCRQADRQKNITIARADRLDEAKKVRDANDGDIVPLAGKQNRIGSAVTEEVRSGGIDQQNFVFLQAAIKLFDEAADNLSLRGGLSPQSPTASQDQMLDSHSSVMEFDKKSRVVHFVKSQLEKYVYFHWSDPFNTFEEDAEFAPIGDMLVALPPELRDMGFEQFGIEIIPYSMEYRSPKNDRGEFIENMREATQYMGNSGYMINFPEFIKGIEERSHTDDLHSMFKAIEQDPEQEEGNVMRYESNARPKGDSVEQRVSTMNSKSAGVAMAQAMADAGQE